MGLFDRFFKKDENTKSKEHFIIAINRQYGSGGTEIANIILEKLNIPLYDEKTIELKAMETGLDENFIRENSDQLLDDTIYDLYRENSIYSNEEDMTSSDTLFLAESKVIRDLAKIGPCIILEKSGGYVLREYKNVLKVFFTAPYDFRFNRAVNVYKDREEKAEGKIRQMDTRRKNQFYKNTGEIWGEASCYDLCINTSTMDFNSIADILVEVAKKRGLI